MMPPQVPAAPPGSPSFRVSGLNLPAGLPDLFGVWQAPARSTPAAAAGSGPTAAAPEFAPPPGGAGLPEPGDPQWQIVLPSDLAAARKLLISGQAAVEQQRQALRYARRILDDAQSRQKLHRRRNLATRTAAPQGVAPILPAGFAGPSALAAIFAQPLLEPAAVPAVPPPISPAEALLLQKLNALAALGDAGTAAAPPAAAAPELIAGITLPWDQVKQFADQWQAFSADVLNLFAHYADIQTAIAAGADSAIGAPALPIARTVVDWGGNFETGWLPGLSADRKALHVHAVHLALASRLALVHLVGTVATSAVTLVLASPTVIAFAAALPAVFQAVQGAVQEYLALQHAAAT